MSAEALRLLAGEAPAPVTLDGAAVAGLIAAAHDAGARVAELRAPATKTALFDAISAGLRYPDWWGRNWDALSELLHFPDPAPAPAEPAPEPATDPAPAPPPS